MTVDSSYNNGIGGNIPMLLTRKDASRRPWVRTWLSGALSIIVCLLHASGGARAEYPAKPVRLIVPYATGGSSDIVARLLGERLEKELGQPVVIENSGGAGGAVGAQRVQTARPDGYTLLIGAGSELLIRGLLQPTPYETTRDFTPITLIGTGPMVLVGKRDLPAEKLEDLLVLARSQPGKLFYGSAGQGTFMHILGEAFKSKAGLDIGHVPYKGAAPLMTDVLGGHVDLGVASLASALPAIKRAQVHGYAVSSLQRVPFAPDIPALAEVNELAGLELELWIGLFGPRGLSPDIVSRLQSASTRIIGTADFRERLAEQALVARSMTGDEFRSYLERERLKYKEIIEKATISME
jgi:tripartite-type tricarboxylate transporter receptor subunit TctC